MSAWVSRVAASQLFVCVKKCSNNLSNCLSFVLTKNFFWKILWDLDPKSLQTILNQSASDSDDATQPNRRTMTQLLHQGFSESGDHHDCRSNEDASSVRQNNATGTQRWASGRGYMVVAVLFLTAIPIDKSRYQRPLRSVGHADGGSKDCGFTRRWTWKRPSHSVPL